MVGDMDRHVAAAGLAAGDQQRRSRPHHHARGHVVEVSQRGLRHPHCGGHFSELHRARSGPRGPTGQRTPIGPEVSDEPVGVVVGQQELGGARGHDHRFVHLGIEVLELLARQTGQPCGQGHVDVPLNGHRHKIGVVLQRRQGQPVLRRLADQILHGLELGHVIARFRGHAQAQVVGRQPFGGVAGDGTADVAFAPVVGSQSQVPAAEHAMQAVQVVERGVRGRQDVPAVVTEHVLLERKVATGGRHELPHARGLGRGHGLRVEGAFDEGQQGQFRRHPAPLEFLDDVIEVHGTAPGHALKIVRTIRVPAFVLDHEIVFQIGHAVSGADACPQVLVGLGIVHPDRLARLERVFRLTHGVLGALFGRRGWGGGRGLDLGDLGGRLDGVDRMGGRGAAGQGQDEGHGRQAQGPQDTKQGRTAAGGAGRHRAVIFHSRKAVNTGIGPAVATRSDPVAGDSAAEVTAPEGVEGQQIRSQGPDGLEGLRASTGRREHPESVVIGTDLAGESENPVSILMEGVDPGMAG